MDLINSQKQLIEQLASTTDSIIDLYSDWYHQPAVNNLEVSRQTRQKRALPNLGKHFLRMLA
ncbi:unnamed protein product [Notodromas monacha]|nr:unnamed protein product [Notodromas monacha]CAG0926034.1 unnamed protein product [Notodromas monacha]